MDIIKQIISDYFESHSDDENARNMKAYMRNQYAFYGLKSKVRRVLSSQLWKDHKSYIIENWKELVEYLWNQAEREHQHLAMDLMVKVKKHMKKEDLGFIESLILRKSWWDTVDLIAAHHVGALLKEDKKFQRETVERYMSSGEMWLIRTALIFQLSYKSETDAEMLYGLIDRVVGSKEFFINKAAGWALRQYSKFNPESVRKYLEMRGDKLANLTKREARKYL